jgi:hypothetical protein
MPEQVYEHKKLGLRLVLPAKDDVLTRDVNRWAAAMRKYRGGDRGLAGHQLQTVIFQGALDAGLVHEPAGLTAEAVPDMPPVHVAWYGDRLADFYEAITEIPPDVEPEVNNEQHE